MRSWKMCCIAVIIGAVVGYLVWHPIGMKDDPIHGAVVGIIAGLFAYAVFSGLIQMIRNRMD